MVTDARARVSEGDEFRIEVEDADLRTELVRVLDPLSNPDPRPGPGLLYRITHTPFGFDLEVNGHPLTTETSGPVTLRTLLSDLNAAPLPHVTGAVVLHAGAVEISGGAVVMPGASNSGKSTLVAQLLERGHAYLSDEAVPIESETLRVRPFPKSLCIDRGDPATACRWTESTPATSSRRSAPTVSSRAAAGSRSCRTASSR